MPAKMLEITATYIADRPGCRWSGANGDTIIGDAMMYGDRPDANGLHSPVKAEPVTLKGVADDEGPIAHQAYRFYGHWSSYTNPRTGKSERQFLFSTFVLCTPHSRAGIVGYLAKAPGVGRTLAGRLFDNFGSNAVKILREQPTVAAASCDRLSDEAAASASQWLGEQAALEGCTIDLIDLLEGRGFRKSIAKQAVKAWGNRAAGFIRRNPYLLMRFTGVGFKLADKLYLELGGNAAALKRQSLSAWYSVASNGSGDTWHYSGVTEKGVLANIGNAASSMFGKAIRLATRVGMLVSTFTEWQHGPPSWDGNFQWLAEQRKAANERRVAIELAAATLEPPFPISPLYGEPLTDHQVSNLIKAVSGGAIGILGGSPGTGKTFVASHYIKSVIADFGVDAIAVAAPTGKAAVRITESLAANGVPLKAKTIHSLLKVEQQTDGGGWKFQHNAKNPLPFLFIVVDESSMVDTDLMSSLLSARATGCCMLFVGDVNQLPPVGHGAPLRDMIAAGLPYGELSEIRRQADSEGGIVFACRDMKDGKQFECGGDLMLIPAESPEQQLTDTLATLEDQRSHGLDPVWDCQVLVAVNKRSALSRRDVNKYLQAALNPNPAIPNSPFRMADKCVNTKNRFYPVVSPIKPDDDETTTNDRGEVYVANGELGEVIAVEPKYLEIKLQLPSRLIRVPRGVSDDASNGDTDPDEETGTGCDWDLAYALSVHKAQGSEWGCVIVLIDEYAGARRICDRAWLYTAISRAKQRCFLVGKIATAQRFCRVNNISKRKTFLTPLIAEQITKQRQGRRPSAPIIPSRNSSPVMEEMSV